MKFIFLVIAAGMIFFCSKATENPSLYFTYKHLSGLQWEITVYWYYNCNYYQGSWNTLTYALHDTCNNQSKINGSAYLQSSQPSGYPAWHNIITDYCPSTLTMCDSPFNATGFISWRLVTYKDTITLPESCGLWKFSLGSPSQFAFRDPFITNIQSSYWTAYGEAILNADTNLGNSSALWVRPMFAYANADQQTQWHLPVYDDDGDSLVMSLVKPRERDKMAPNPLDTLVQDIDFLSPFSLTEPFQTNGTFQFDPNIPAVQFKAIANQLVLLCFKVDEYRNGVYLGSTFREALWHTLPTLRPNPQRSIQTASLQNAIPGAYDTITVYANYAMNLCTHYVSSGISAELRHESNTTAVLPNATYSVQTLGDTVYTCLQWTPSLADTGYHLLVTTITDTSCLVNGPRIPQDFFYKVMVKKAPSSTEETPTINCRLYPNPVKDVLYVEGIKSSTIKIYNSIGKLVICEKTDTGFTHRLATGELPDGLYLLQTNNKIMRFIVNH